MSDQRPGLGDFGFIIAARALASLIVALGVTMAMLLILMTEYLQAAACLLVFLAGAFWAHRLIRDLEHGRVLMPFGSIHRSRQPALFWFSFVFCCTLVLLLLAGTADYMFFR